MVRPLLVRRLAEADIESAAQWYEGERAGLGARFLADLDRTFTRIREQPLQFPSIGDDIRRALLPTFPYAVYFRASADLLVVIAVLHLKRHQGTWRKRAQ